MSKTERNVMEREDRVQLLAEDIQQQMQERSKLMLQLGEIAFAEIRKGSLELQGHEAFTSEILEKDKAAFSLKNELSTLQKVFTQRECECGNAVSLQDTFCGSCGTAIQKTSIPPAQNVSTCFQCHTKIPEEAVYCPCCGTNRTEKVS